jgi:uncharacterized protein YqeY
MTGDGGTLRGRLRGALPAAMKARDAAAVAALRSALAAADAYERAGQAERAGRLRAEADVLSSHLDGPAAGGGAGER